MRVFRIVADATFHAQDIDDALKCIAHHFATKGKNSMLISGAMEVRPAEVRDPISVEHGLREALKLALHALNETPRFRVSKTPDELNDSYKIAAALERVLRG